MHEDADQPVVDWQWGNVGQQQRTQNVDWLQQWMRDQDQCNANPDQHDGSSPDKVAAGRILNVVDPWRLTAHGNRGIAKGSAFQWLTSHVGDVFGIFCGLFITRVGVKDNRNLGDLTVGWHVVVDCWLEGLAVQNRLRNVEGFSSCRLLQTSQIALTLAKSRVQLVKAVGDLWWALRQLVDAGVKLQTAGTKLSHPGT